MRGSPRVWSQSALSPGSEAMLVLIHTTPWDSSPTCGELILARAPWSIGFLPGREGYLNRLFPCTAPFAQKVLVKLGLKNRQRSRRGCDDRCHACGYSRSDGGIHDPRPLTVDQVFRSADLSVGNDGRLSEIQNGPRRIVAVPFDLPFRRQLAPTQFQFLKDIVHTTGSLTCAIGTHES